MITVTITDNVGFIAPTPTTYKGYEKRVARIKREVMHAYFGKPELDTNGRIEVIFVDRFGKRIA